MNDGHPESNERPLQSLHRATTVTVRPKLPVTVQGSVSTYQQHLRPGSFPSQLRSLVAPPVQPSRLLRRHPASFAAGRLLGGHPASLAAGRLLRRHPASFAASLAASFATVRLLGPLAPPPFFKQWSFSHPMPAYCGTPSRELAQYGGSAYQYAAAPCCSGLPSNARCRPSQVRGTGHSPRNIGIVGNYEVP
ncbi:hypothetical protein OH77DRAFT_1436011 [Trametes cingulata]|nr:hypothetical protein OH77DRAFT_1436011 [Trametes cingulata]